MPRLARLDAPGVLHHVMGRGIKRRKIFWNDKDQVDFIDRLAKVVEKGGMDIYAWALIPNHLLCKTRNWPLSTSMRRILTGYVVNFNKRHKRRGHLFQNRYKSIGYSGADVARYLGVTNSCITKSVSSGKKPDMRDYVNQA